VVEVGAEVAGLDLLAQVAVGGGDDACLADPLLGFADPLVLAVFQHSQQLRLEVEGQFADLVEEKRAVGGIFEVAGFGRDGAGERAPGIAEQGGFNQIGRYRGTIECQKWPQSASGFVMQTTGGNDLLAAARLALDQDREW
jgi:hypothetical protein